MIPVARRSSSSRTALRLEDDGRLDSNINTSPDPLLVEPRAAFDIAQRRTCGLARRF